jgi:hypothetical protein
MAMCVDKRERHSGEWANWSWFAPTRQTLQSHNFVHANRPQDYLDFGRKTMKMIMPWSLSQQSKTCQDKKNNTNKKGNQLIVVCSWEFAADSYTIFANSENLCWLCHLFFNGVSLNQQESYSKRVKEVLTTCCLANYCKFHLYVPCGKPIPS